MSDPDIFNTDQYVILYDRMYPMTNKWSYGQIFNCMSKKDMINTYNRIIEDESFSDVHMYVEYIP